jgi:hypothetical protein
MSGMFFSLKETAQQLGKSEDQVKQLVKAGKLREFRDGANLLFKIDEVNALVSEGIDVGLEAVDLEETPAEEQPVEEQPVEAVEEETIPLADEDLFRLDEEETPTLEPTAEVEATSELGLAPEGTGADETAAGEEELLLLNEDQPIADGTAEITAEGTAEGTADGSEEISLAAESGVLAAGSDITDADTALTTGEGVNVLGESSTDFNVTDDSMAETAVGPAGSSAEASLEEIEDDVSLDSFGSGSGLLDLSLQADDTSLGGILDEIYTSEGGEAAEGSGEAGAAEGEPAGVGEEAGSFDDITAEAEHPAGGEEEMPVPEPVAIMPTAMGGVYAEAAPDAQSNILGMLLFLPMLALLYTTIVAVAGLRHVTPSILSSIQGLIWYLLGGAIVVSLIVVAVSFMAGRERGETRVRAKKVKAEKPKKEKNAKAERSAKAEKSAKEKKSFFGKKKK